MPAEPRKRKFVLGAIGKLPVTCASGKSVFSWITPSIQFQPVFLCNSIRAAVEEECRLKIILYDGNPVLHISKSLKVAPGSVAV